MSVTVRIAAPRDAAPIARVHVATWRLAYRGIVAQPWLDALRDEDHDAKWRRILADVPAARRHWVAERDGEVIGFASAGPARGEASEVGEVYAIYVAPASWGTGAGRALLAAALAFLTPRYPAAILWVIAGNARARTFYERQGFAPDGAERVEHEGETRFHELRYRRALG